MQARVRIIKRGAQNVLHAVSENEIAKSDREREREAVDTVKGWVADWHARKRSMHTAAILLVRSIDRGRESSTKRFAPANS